MFRCLRDGYLDGEQDGADVVIDAGDVVLRGGVQEEDVGDTQERYQHQQGFGGFAVLLGLRIVGRPQLCDQNLTREYQVSQKYSQVFHGKKRLLGL